MTLSLIDLLAPEFLHEEILDHLPELRHRAGLSERSASELLALLEGYITIIPAEQLLPEWERAATAMGAIDPRDTATVAAALAMPCDGIWSDDSHLRAQQVVPCWTTKELVVALAKVSAKP